MAIPDVLVTLRFRLVVEILLRNCGLRLKFPFSIHFVRNRYEFVLSFVRSFRLYFSLHTVCRLSSFLPSIFPFRIWYTTLVTFAESEIRDSYGGSPRFARSKHGHAYSPVEKKGQASGEQIFRLSFVLSFFGATRRGPRPLERSPTSRPVDLFVL